MATDKPGFFAELKRRHVVRVAIAYVVAGWLLVQVATQVFPFFRIPDWAVRLVVLLIVIGFPVAVAFAWVFELTPEGIRRTTPADSPEARAPQAHRSVGQKLNAIIVAMLVLAVAFLGWRLHAVRHQPAADVTDAFPGSTATVASAPGTSTPSIPARSVAVLPFENLSDDKKNEYFVAGMQDLILTKLADIGTLKVISRTSTEKYKSRPDNLKRVAAELGVAALLEGSVQKAGDQVLVNVQLIDAKTDSHIWAQSYTRTLDNVFNVEGDVAEKIATALNAKLSPAQSAQLAAAPTTDQAAYDLFLRAEFQANRGSVDHDTASFKAAIPLYRQAVAHDPNFALAYARLSYAESDLAWLGSGEDIKQLIALARADAERALQLAPDLAAAHIAIGYCDYYGKGDYVAALRAFDTALTLRPNDAEALAARGYIERRQGRFDDAIASLQQALVRNPRDSVLASEIGITSMMASRYAEAGVWFRRALALDPNNLNAKTFYSSTIVLDSGDVARALTVVAGDAPPLKQQQASLLVVQRKYREAIALTDSIPDTPDNFSIFSSSKAAQLADLYRLEGDMARARPLFEQALPSARAQLSRQQGINLASAWQNVADVELGLGRAAEGQGAVAKAQAIVAGNGNHSYDAVMMEINASLYAEAKRPDLAVPLLARALSAPGIGYDYSPLMLWLDPAWDPIHNDPGFQALLKKYSKYKPAVTYDTAPTAASTTAGSMP